MSQNKGTILKIILKSMNLVDWICVWGDHHYIFNEEYGWKILKFFLDKATKVLTYFKVDETKTNEPIEEVIFNKDQAPTKKYDAFPFNKIGTVILNILFKLVKANDPFLNQILIEANFGYWFGEFLMLEYDFLKHCIDYNIEGLVLIDTFVKKNEIRLNTF